MEAVNPPIDVAFVLSFVNSLSLCRGFQNPHVSRALQGPQNEGLIQINFNGDDVIFSKDCDFFLVGSKSTSCSQCRKLSKSVIRRKEEYANIMRTKNNLLTDVDKVQKIEELNKEKRLLRAKLENCKRFQEECFIVDADDNTDFLSMMSYVDSSKVNDDMKLLLKEQEKAICTPSKNAYRWHPK